MPLNHYDYLTVVYIADISSFLLPHLSELSSREEEQYSGLSSHSDFLFRVRVSFFYNSTVEIMHRYKTRIFEFLQTRHYKIMLILYKLYNTLSNYLIVFKKILIERQNQTTYTNNRKVKIGIQFHHRNQTIQFKGYEI